MALWRWSEEWEKVSWYSPERRGRAVLYGCGESLNSADPIEYGAVRFVQNRAVERVEPHIWIGMDKPEIFGKSLFDKPFRKVLRGAYSKEKVDGIPIREFGDVYFADVKVRPRQWIWQNRGREVDFAWGKNTLIVALHLILWMGFKEIIFSGIDLGGKYFNNQLIPSLARHNQLFEEEFDYLSWFARTAKLQGIKLVNRSENSRLAEIMETKVKG